MTANDKTWSTGQVSCGKGHFCFPATHRSPLREPPPQAEGLSTRIVPDRMPGEGKQPDDLAASRLRIVADFLTENPVERAAAEPALGINLAHHHVAVVLWALPGSDVSPRQLNRLAVEFAHVSEARQSLIIPVVSPAEVWMWIGWLDVPERGLVTRTREALSPPQGVRASVGPVAPGVKGFRHSHLSAQAAARVVSMGGWDTSWLCEYDDLAVVSLLTSDPQHARDFAEEILGPLAKPGRDVATLRETLRVYLAFRNSRVRAAEILHVARNTVAYRVNKATKLIGRPISGDALQVRLALEIARVLRLDS